MLFLKTCICSSNFPPLNVVFVSRDTSIEKFALNISKMFKIINIIASYFSHHEANSSVQ